MCMCMCAGTWGISNSSPYKSLYLTRTVKLVYFSHRANEVTILGTRYTKGSIVGVKAEGGEEDDPFLYTCIEDIYIHKDNKMFLLRVLIVLNHSEHFRLIRIDFSDQVFFCVYNI